MDSNDCWAVGNARNFIRWNGSSWAVQTTSVSTLPSANYSSVYCVDSDDCWAVANNIADVYVHWNGSAWSRDASRPGASTLNAVNCGSSDDCWAVGAGPATIHWNGTNWTAFGNPGPGSVVLTSVGVVSSHYSVKTIWKESFP
jgi:hypothetical protein